MQAVTVSAKTEKPAYVGLRAAALLAVSVAFLSCVYWRIDLVRVYSPIRYFPFPLDAADSHISEHITRQLGLLMVCESVALVSLLSIAWSCSMTAMRHRSHALGAVGACAFASTFLFVGGYILVPAVVAIAFFQIMLASDVLRAWSSPSVGNAWSALSWVAVAAAVDCSLFMLARNADMLGLIV